MSIVITSKNGQSAIVEKSSVAKEDFLQEFIHNNPEVIPIYEIEEDRKLLIVRREFPTHSGPIDALAVDELGNLYVIETKLFKNADKRTVVAQALDYGAALWKHCTDFQQFIGILDKAIQDKFNLTFEEKIQEFFSASENTYGLFLRNLRNNLNEGNIKFVILMDSMDERLKTLIHYVNQNSQFDIYAVRLEFYEFDEQQIIIPKIFGVDIKKNVKGNVSENQWDEENFFREFERKGMAVEATVARRILNWAQPRSSRLWWGKGSVNGSFIPVHNDGREDHYLFALFTSGKLQVYFQWMLKKRPFDDENKRIELMNRLNKIPGVNLTEENLTKRPSIKIKHLDNDTHFQIFIDAYTWFLNEIEQ